MYNTGAIPVSKENQVPKDVLASIREGRSMNMSEVSANSVIEPAPKDKSFKLMNYKKTKHDKKVTFMETIPEDMKDLIESKMETDKSLKSLLDCEMVLIAVGSSTYQNLHEKFDFIVKKIQTFLSSKEMKVAYISPNKVQALEDLTHFFPSLI